MKTTKTPAPAAKLSMSISECDKALAVAFTNAAKATAAKAASAAPFKAAPVTPPPTLMTAAAVTVTNPLPVPEEVDPLLLTILGWPRKHDSMTEKAFCDWLIKLLNLKGHAITMRAAGSFSVEIKRPGDKASTTLFSCHVDTTDCYAIPDAVKELDYDKDFGLITLAKGNKVGSCLGADDGIGVWLMIKMIDAKIPGSYLFHRGEECGGVSAHANKTDVVHQAWLRKHDLAVAFDRPRDNEIITHQGGIECASDKFALALAKELNDHGGFSYAPSNRGVYTDTKEYRYLIPECVNVGVGYQNQHGSQEEQDYAHAYALMQALLKVKWEGLPVDRDAEVAEKRDSAAYSKPKHARHRSYGGYASSLGMGGFGEQEDFYDVWPGAKFEKPRAKPAKAWPAEVFKPRPDAATPEPDLLDEIKGMKYRDLTSMCEDEPAIAAQVLFALIRENARLEADLSTCIFVLEE